MLVSRFGYKAHGIHGRDFTFTQSTINYKVQGKSFCLTGSSRVILLFRGKSFGFFDCWIIMSGLEILTQMHTGFNFTDVLSFISDPTLGQCKWWVANNDWVQKPPKWFKLIDSYSAPTSGKTSPWGCFSRVSVCVCVCVCVRACVCVRERESEWVSGSIKLFLKKVEGKNQTTVFEKRSQSLEKNWQLLSL